MKKISLILALLTALVIVGGLVGCSEYEAPPPPPPAITPSLTITGATPTVFAVGGTIVSASGAGCVFDKTNGYEGGFVYFKVEFSGAFRLNDYSKVTFKASAKSGTASPTTGGDFAGTKRFGLFAFTSTPTTLGTEANTKATSLTTPDNGTNIGPNVTLSSAGDTASTSAANVTLAIDATRAAAYATESTLYLVIFCRSGAGELTITDIKFE